MEDTQNPNTTTNLSSRPTITIHGAKNVLISESAPFDIAIHETENVKIFSVLPDSTAQHAHVADHGTIAEPESDLTALQLASTQQAQKSRLMQLPAELRAKIWVAAIPVVKAYQWEQDWCGYDGGIMGYDLSVVVPTATVLELCHESRVTALKHSRSRLMEWARTYKTCPIVNAYGQVNPNHLDFDYFVAFPRVELISMDYTAFMALYFKEIQGRVGQFEHWADAPWNREVSIEIRNICHFSP